MPQKSIKTSINEIYSKPPIRNYRTNKTDVYHTDDIWSLAILDLKDYGPEIIRGYRHVLVVIDNFSKIGWTIPHKNKTAQTIKDSFEIIIKNSKRSPILVEGDRDLGFYNSIFQDVLNKINFKIYSRNSSIGAVFAERFNRTFKDLLKKVDFEQENVNWFDVLPKVTKQYIIRVHSSTRLSPTESSFTKNERFYYI